MTTTYPTSLQDLDATRGTSSDKLSSPNHVTHHTTEDDTIEALQAKVGADGSAVTTSHDYKLSGVTGSDKAVSKTGTETLTNKTLTSPIITSPTLTVGSDATGDIYYNGGSGVLARLAKGTDNQILKMNGTSLNWEAETVVTAATDTTQGIGILATAAQITAGTASESSYPLFVTPDQLALSTPVFDGSGLTSTLKRTIASNNSKFSANTERAYTGASFSGVIKSFTINSYGVVRITVDIKNDTGTGTWELRDDRGTAVTTNNTASTTYVTQTADFYTYPGMVVSLYTKSTLGTVTVRNVQIMYDNTTFNTGAVITD